MFASNTSQVSSDATYIEDVFSTYLYQGNGSTQTITNGIDLAGKGGLVWTKDRGVANHFLFDTARGVNTALLSNATNANLSLPSTLTAFNANGFSLGSGAQTNTSTNLYASWTFRKQPKFFDVVTFNQSGATSGFQTISHNLGSVPGCIIIKRISSTGQWYTYHRSTPNDYLILNSTAASVNATFCQNLTETTFDWNKGDFGQGDGTDYVAYLFAHNAGGFGLTGTDNVISCGSYTGNGTSNGPVVNLGFEPQWLLIKDASATSNWYVLDNMRGLNLSTVSGSADAALLPNSSSAEINDQYIDINATGFQPKNSGSAWNWNGDTYIYIAIRRGPMKTPTSGASVFSPNTISTVPATFNIGFPLDLIVNQPRNGAQALWGTRLQGPKQYLDSSSTAAEVTAGTAPWAFDKQNDSYAYYAGTSVAWNFRRAPGFFDEVCYTGTGVSGLVVNHNLGVTPELLIYKNRATAGTNWFVLDSTSNYGNLNNNNAFSGPLSISLGPTSYTINTTGTSTNASGQTYVAYLFASCPGVSKVGSYTGNGSSQTINCGFTGGARFVMIKRTDAAGHWKVMDSARGITTSTDPILHLNSTAAELTGYDPIDPESSGFIVNEEDNNLNVNGATYIYLAIA